MKKVILNWSSPAAVQYPSAPMSILKRYLNENNFKCEIVYLNLRFAELQSQFLWRESPLINENEMITLLVFFNYLAFQKNDREVFLLVKAKLMELKPSALNISKFDFFEEHMKMFSKKMDDLFNELLSEIDFSEVLCFGLSVSLNQWIASTIIAEKVKIKSPSTPIIIGGIETKNSAKAYMENFEQFDFAIWGEGEESLLMLVNALNSNINNFNDIPNIAFRNENVCISENSKRNYVDLSGKSIIPDYSEYFIQKNKNPFFDNFTNKIVSLPIESSRGCHWNRCHFCYLNTGYKYRKKSVKSIIGEIRSMISEYGINNFLFLDNDLIGIHVEEFSDFIEELIHLKEEYPEFVIDLAEIITKDINAELIKKMALAGFESVQIGYESPSNNLLKKIDKKNTFASNLLFVKFASIYNIRITGANIIIGLLEETSEDIMEAINNLHVLRFFFSRGRFSHNRSSLSIKNSSHYYKQIQNNKNKYSSDMIISFLPQNYLKIGDEEYNITDAFSNHENYLWNHFFEIEKNYIVNIYEYKLFQKGLNIVYREYSNGLIIKELEFIGGSLDLFILEKVNSKICSFEDLIKSYNMAVAPILDLEMINAIEELKIERILYTSDDYSEIISIIDISQTI
jgi:radical SAM superfamily enzyme YgiQ (UPF0313 family)